MSFRRSDRIYGRIPIDVDAAEAREIISKPFPEELRAASFEHAQRSNIARHRPVLTDLWARR